MYDDEDEEDETDPEWVKDEREDFARMRDKNGDGKLDKDEIRAWIYPHEDDNYVEDEAKHLLKGADENEVGWGKPS